MTPLIDIRGLSKTFSIEKGFMGQQTSELRAVDNVSFTVNEGEAFGIVGESGCGKSTAGRSVLRLIEPSAGEVWYRGEDIMTYGPKQLRSIRREMQMVFQDPYASLNPRMTIGQTLSEPMLFHRTAEKSNVKHKIEQALDEVGLPSAAAKKYPFEFSGGQRQRIGIARALSVNPSLIVADEPVSALDVSIQAQVLRLMEQLQRDRRLSFIFISHDLGVVRHFCDNVAVMYLGKIVEKGQTDEVFETPLHPYTKALRLASPVPDPRQKITVAKIEGDIPSPLSPPTGCHFHPRCPSAMPVCSSRAPEWQEVGLRRGVSCHLYTDASGSLASTT